MAKVVQRSVSFGSKRTPDPMDRYLELHFLYRKHMIRDSSCLFRAVAEQIYDTQMLHYEVRQECVRYMFRKRSSFRPYVRGDYDNYLYLLKRRKTKGTMLELRALCHLYRRNAIIYKPFELGKFVVYDKAYPETIHIFVSHQEYFDSVMTMSEIEMAAVCQAVAYKLVYKNLFRLPDVNLAVEWMLYPQTFNCINFEFDQQGNVISLVCCNGRIFRLDRPEHTVCLLDNYEQCPFHNSRLKFGQQNKQSSPMSCMRHILEQNGTPFRYSVAKALDPYNYRNFEFISQIVRLEAQLRNIYLGDYNFKVGAKCLVDLHNNKKQLSTCHIQAINNNKTYCKVFVEQLGKLLEVPYDKLHPLPPGEFKPWDCCSKNGETLRRDFQMWRMQMPNVSIQSCNNGIQNEWVNVPLTQHAQGNPLPAQQKIVNVPPQHTMPPPLAVPRPYFVQASQTFFGRPPLMLNNQPMPPRPFPPHHMIIRPPTPATFIITTRGPAPPSMMPPSFIVHNSPLMINTNNGNPPPT
ncbi:protein ovarian tumor locus [Drosophila eugracilis]|uniref:protein ovarian tumor locus n=1 Tax=Drosophila eugracilis TaxID=29029 RepID=UPI001BDA58B0|nr:protein ovarian tumor locus [Drosophila eugracilis]